MGYHENPIEDPDITYGPADPIEKECPRCHGACYLEEDGEKNTCPICEGNETVDYDEDD